MSMVAYVSKKTFKLNFEDKSPSIQVKEGDTLLYDGNAVVFTDANGKKFEGRTPHLKGAIVSGWIVSKSEDAPAPVTTQSPSEPEITYDGLKGGNFDVYAKKMNDPVKFEKNVILEKDLVVKNLTPEETSAAKESEKLEVAADQVDVSDRLTVTSSTTTPRKRTHDTTIRPAEHYGADETIEMTRLPKKEEKEEAKRFTVDETTPALPEDTTLKDVRKAQKIINADESPDAKVVGRIKRGQMEVTEIDGVVLKKGGSAPQEINVSVTVGPGGTPISDLSTGTDAQVVAKKDQPTTDLAAALPENFSKMHWVKKEKFVKVQSNPDLIKYIMGNEKTKAIQNACKARLKELGQ